MKILTLITLFTFTHSLQAENHLLILGGGGEPKGDTTIFDKGINDFGKNLKRSNWKYDVSFNGGHRKTENIIKNKYSSGNTPPSNITPENFTKLIANYKNKILNGDIRSGDQLIILVNTHGAVKTYGELTHSISISGGEVTNLNSLEGSDSDSLDKLQEIVKLTNERGINLGIIDLSCHSGNTLALKKNSTNTCIISASGPNHYAYQGPRTFSENFLSNLKPGVNLEEAFLKSRLATTDTSYPMISTNENDKIVKDIYSSITPYLYYYDPDGDKLSPYFHENSTPSQLCKREEDFGQLMTKIDSLKSILNSKKNNYKGDKLKSLLQDYKKNQDGIFKAIEQIGVFNLENVEVFSIPANANNLLSIKNVKYTWKELLNQNVDIQIDYYEEYLNNPLAEEEKNEIQSALNLLRQVKSKKQQILNQNPQLKNYQHQIDLIIKASDLSSALVKKIAIQEKQLYEELYRRNQNINPKDPCKKIFF